MPWFATEGRSTINNGYGKARPKAEHSYVADALDAILDGRKPETSATTVVGCPIERADAKTADTLKIPKIRSADPSILEARKAEDEAAKVGPVDYASNVATILQNKCQNCHRPKARRAVFAPLVRRRQAMGRDDSRGCGRSPDAPLACRSPLRPLRERP